MAEPWLQHYDPGVPQSIGRYPEKTLVDFVAEHAAAKPDSIAIAFKGANYTYRDIHEASEALAHSLVKVGVREGDRVALLLPNCPQFIISELAIWKAGGIIVPQNPIYTERELEESIATTQPETMIVFNRFYGRVKSFQSRTALKRVIATNVKEYLPRHLAILFSLFKEKKEGDRIEILSGDFWFKDLIEQGRPLGKFKSAAKYDAPASILMSGGTTGTPKGVLAPHGAFVKSGMQLSAWLQEALKGSVTIMLPLPLFHTYGCHGVQSMALVAGSKLVLVPNPRDMNDLLATVNREKPTFFTSVPTLFNAMLAHPDVQNGKIDFRSIRACFSGAAALMAETKKRFEELTGGKIVEGYSLTEASMAVCANPLKGNNKIGSIGMPLPDVKVRIVDDAKGETDLPSGEVGEIVMNAPQLMTGYWNNQQETDNMLRLHPDGVAWLHTGDLGYMDEDGYIFIVDRKKDLIKTSGFQVWPREIEEVIASHPSVAEVGVAGVPHPKKGEVIHAWVVLRADAPPIGEDALRAYCREKLAPYKVPALIEIRKELPKTMVGKVLRRVLVAEAVKKAED